jgi:hypothetical protein
MEARGTVAGLSKQGRLRCALGGGHNNRQTLSGPKPSPKSGGLGVAAELASRTRTTSNAGPQGACQPTHAGPRSTLTATTPGLRRLDEPPAA